MQARTRIRAGATMPSAAMPRPLHSDQFATRRKALDLLLAWPEYSMDQLGQMFEQFTELPDEDRSALIDRGEAWLTAGASDLDRSELAERLRRIYFAAISVAGQMVRKPIALRHSPQSWCRKTF
ncbi:MAG: hypothetical protein HC938_14695 [Nitrospira sp.]|nr:hypothetical protein [Nitrospira sp.]